VFFFTVTTGSGQRQHHQTGCSILENKTPLTDCQTEEVNGSGTHARCQCVACPVSNDIMSACADPENGLDILFPSLVSKITHICPLHGNQKGLLRALFFVLFNVNQ
jgi:hypothetical protein